MLDKKRLKKLLSDCRWGNPAHICPAVSSTNTILLETAMQRTDGEVLIAEKQTAGRGQRDRSWWSGDDGDLAMSLLVRPPCAASQVASMALLVSLAVRWAIGQISGLDTMIKWPNDIVVNGKKLAGVLCEAKIRGTYVDCLVIGIGMNVNGRKFPPEIDRRASSIFLQTHQYTDRTALAAQIIRVLEEWMPLWLDERGRAELLLEYEKASAVIGQQVKWQTLNGEKSQGKVLGFEPSGALRLLNLSGEIHYYYAGEVNTITPLEGEAR